MVTLDSPLSSDSGLRRPRASIACESCRRRKVRCDSVHPACGHCSKNNVNCVYIPTRRHLSTVPATQSSSQGIQKPKKYEHTPISRPSERTTIESRLARIEEMLQRLTDSSESKYDSHEETTMASDQADEDELDKEAGPHFPVVSSVKLSMGGYRTSPQVPIEEVNCYSHGISSSVLSPHHISWLGDRIGDPTLSKSLANDVKDMWKNRLMALQNMSDTVKDPLSLDQDFLDYCLDRYNEFEHTCMGLLLPPREVQQMRRRVSWEESARRGSPYTIIYATVLIAVCLKMRSTRDSLNYNYNFHSRQIGIAFFQGARAMNMVPVGPPTYSMIRTVVMFVAVATGVSALPQIEPLLALAFRLSKTIGLNREEFYENLSPTEARVRQITWWLCYNCDQALSVFLGQAPNFPEEEISTPLPDVSDADTPLDLKLMPLMVKLHRLYARTYRHLYSVQAWRRNNDPKRPALPPIKELVKLDHDLESWKSQFDSFVRSCDDSPHHPTSLAPTCSDSRWLYDYIIHHMDVEYRMILLQLFSPLAFTSLTIPGASPRISNALQLTAETSVELLELVRIMHLSSKSGHCAAHLASSACISTAFGTLFFKQVLFPHHPTNEQERTLFHNYIAAFQFEKPSPRSCDTFNTFNDALGRFWYRMAGALEAYAKIIAEEASASNSGRNDSLNISASSTSASPQSPWTVREQQRDYPLRNANGRPPNNGTIGASQVPLPVHPGHNPLPLEQPLSPQPSQPEMLPSIQPPPQQSVVFPPKPHMTHGLNGIPNDVSQDPDIGYDSRFLDELFPEYGSSPGNLFGVQDLPTDKCVIS